MKGSHMDNLNHLITRIGRFLQSEIWQLRLDEIPRVKAVPIKFLRIAVISVRGFAEDNCLLRASSLTFYCLLSIVPVAAMAFGIAKGFGFEKRLETQLLEQIPGQEEVLLQVVDAAHRFLENTQGGLIAGIGVVVLFWSVVKVLSHIESAFNRIWQIDRPRTFGRKFADYLSIMLIGPVMVIMSSSVTVFITTRITEITQKVALLGMLSALIFSLLKLLPYGLIWVLFTIMYMLMPNTRVRFGPGFLAGVMAGTAYQIAQWAYISFQVGVARYNAIYGSFAALPLFLIWLQISWMIVLFGAEISYAGQHGDTYEPESAYSRISPYLRQVIALMVARLIVKRFSAGKMPLTSQGISDQLALPQTLVRQSLDNLVDSQTVARTCSADLDPPVYQPAVDIGRLTVHRVMEALMRTGSEDIGMKPTPEFESLDRTLKAFSEAVDRSAANKLLKDV